MRKRRYSLYKETTDINIDDFLKKNFGTVLFLVDDYLDEETLVDTAFEGDWDFLYSCTGKEKVIQYANADFDELLENIDFLVDDIIENPEDYEDMDWIHEPYISSKLKEQHFFECFRRKPARKLSPARRALR